MVSRMIFHRRIALLLIICVNLLFASCGNSSDKPGQVTITVAAAADLGNAFGEIAKAFEQSTGTKVVISPGSTGLLTKQIENGAPMDVFAAANTSFIDELDKNGLIIPDTKALYARGQITLWTRADSSIKVERIQDLTGRKSRRSRSRILIMRRTGLLLAMR